MQDVLEPQAKTRARPEPRRGQKGESTRLFQLEKEGTSTIQGSSSSSADVPVGSSMAASVSVEDMVQTDVLTSTSVETQPASAGAMGTLCVNESKAKDPREIDKSCVDIKCMSKNHQHGIDARCLVKTCVDMCAVDLTEFYSPAIFNERSIQLGLSTGVAAELETGWNLDT